VIYIRIKIFLIVIFIFIFCIKIYHGDIKTENVLVTSWNWVYLADFAGYKPTYLPEVFILFI
jgi:serine/threonine protein kinase